MRPPAGGFGGVFRVAQHAHSVTDHSGEMLDTIEQFGLHRNWRLAQIVGGVGEIIPHQSERALETLMIGAAPLGATPSLLKFPKLNYFCHSQLRHRQIPASGH